VTRRIVAVTVADHPPLKWGSGAAKKMWGIGRVIDLQRRKSPVFFVLVSLPATAMGFALSVQISVLSWMLGTRYNLRIDEIGFVWAAGPLAGILGQVIVGALSDRIWFWNGRRRVFIIAGGALAALALLLLPELGVISNALGLESVVGVALVVALALDLAVNVGFNPTRALIADVTRAGPERTHAYSTMQIVSGSFGVGAYAIGAIYGNYVLIYAAVALVMFFAVLPTLVIEEPRIVQESAAAAQPRVSARTVFGALSPLWALLLYNVYAFGEAFHWAPPATPLPEILCGVATAALIAAAFFGRQDAQSPFRKVIAASALCWLGVQPIFIFMFSFLQDRMPGLSNTELGQVTSISFLALNAVAALAPIGLGPLAARFGAIPVHVAAIASMSAGFMAIWVVADTPPVLYALMAFCGIGWGSIVSLPFAIMSQRVDGTRMGLFMGLFNLSVVLPQLVASFGIARFVASADDKGLVFALSGLFLAGSALIWWAARAQPGDRFSAKPR